MTTAELIIFIDDNTPSWVKVKPSRGRTTEHFFRGSKKGGHIIRHRVTDFKHEEEGISWDQMRLKWKRTSWTLLEIL